MELSKSVVDGTQRHLGLDRCRHFFWLGVVFDTVGVAVLFTGVFADLLFYDLLLFLGSIIIFLSLLWWVFWYTGNMEMPPEEHLVFGRPFHMHSSTVVEALRQRVSHRFSLTLGNVSNTLLQIRKLRRRRVVPTSLSLSMTISGQLEKQPEKEHEDTNTTECVKENSDAQDFCRENLGSKPEDVGNSEAVYSPGSDANLPRFLTETL
ncbi:transmembrane protein 238-like [Choloepus didactylus]|uniref:transmembrane protein 238-like n=1 Tax=Choloepus didactylus TaxID=27675 RepID=UPI00189CF78A|nr:transmembrane protein 238-like [Choloepus didactylus]